MKTSLKFQSALLGTVLAVACGSAAAGVIQIGGGADTPNGKFSTKAGVCTLDFDGSTCAGVTESGNLPGSVVIGSSSGLYASPVNDSSHYLTVSPSAATPITFTTGLANYFGFYAGSLDSFNLVQFYNGATLVDSFTGTAINMVAFGTSPTGNQAQAQYIDYFPTAAYTSVVLSSSANAFELDNLAIGNANPNGVPEPASLALLGLGAVGLFAARRRRA